MAHEPARQRMAVYAFLSTICIVTAAGLVLGYFRWSPLLTDLIDILRNLLYVIAIPIFLFLYRKFAGMSEEETLANEALAFATVAALLISGFLHVGLYLTHLAATDICAQSSAKLAETAFGFRCARVIGTTIRDYVVLPTAVACCFVAGWSLRSSTIRLNPRPFYAICAVILITTVLSVFVFELLRIDSVGYIEFARSETMILEVILQALLATIFVGIGYLVHAMGSILALTMRRP